MFFYLFGIIFLYLVWKLKDYFDFKDVKNYSKTSTPLIKSAFNIAFLSQEEIFAYLRRNADRFQGSYAHWFFGLWSFEICRAKDAEQILGSAKHIDKSNIYNLLHPFLKTGLLTSNGEKWHTRRRLLTPAFHFDILKEYLEVFREESDRLVMSLKSMNGKEVDIVPIATQFTLNTICESAMGVKLSGFGNDGIIYRKNIYQMGTLLLSRLLRPWLMSDFVYSLLGHKKQMDEVLKPVLAFTKSIIATRKANFTNTTIEETPEEVELNENIYFRSKKRRYAMMDTLLQAEQQGLIDDEGIIEETDTFTFEGHDTTSSAITFIILLLAHHPEAQEAIFNEIQEFLHMKDELTIDDFNRFEYMDRVLKECMRIYPPVPFISRNLAEDYQHDGFVQPKGTTVNIHIFDIHRDPEIFPDPEKFDPDRFLPENCAKRSNFAFIAFSAGMRNCIGQRFAMLELKMVVSKLVSNFKIVPITQREDITFVGDMILRSREPIRIKFIRK
ncbi:putative cytochrome P450 4ac2 [Pseudolycoriella hygida]|uniref:Cytochrome P450 4ac2 n=1 Tax=Pseudolycoriella hygida TaxID=35572 RepID=A0A9Q0MIB9_9DIPT|nr:putative cytochrome P450 4ac2 [Pseudolycoriella hygida]